MKKLQSIVSQEYAADSINTIDGIRVTCQTGWWLIRASNTEAALVARAEATSPSELNKIILQVETMLAGAGLSLSFT